MSNTQKTRDPVNPYTPIKGNDQGVELVQLVIDWYRGHRKVFTAAEVANIATAITAVLNETTMV